MLLTSLTTIAGLFPLLLERSFQAQFLIPMAVSISFGLLAATILTLLFVPALYLIVRDVTGLLTGWLKREERGRAGKQLAPEIDAQPVGENRQVQVVDHARESRQGALEAHARQAIPRGQPHALAQSGQGPGAVGWGGPGRVAEAVEIEIVAGDHQPVGGGPGVDADTGAGQGAPQARHVALHRVAGGGWGCVTEDGVDGGRCPPSGRDRPGARPARAPPRRARG